MQLPQHHEAAVHFALGGLSLGQGSCALTVKYGGLRAFRHSLQSLIGFTCPFEVSPCLDPQEWFRRCCTLWLKTSFGVRFQPLRRPAGLPKLYSLHVSLTRGHVVVQDSGSSAMWYRCDCCKALLCGPGRLYIVMSLFCRCHCNVQRRPATKMMTTNAPPSQTPKRRTSTVYHLHEPLAKILVFDHITRNDARYAKEAAAGEVTQLRQK